MTYRNLISALIIILFWFKVQISTIFRGFLPILANFWHFIIENIGQNSIGSKKKSRDFHMLDGFKPNRGLSDIFGELHLVHILRVTYWIVECHFFGNDGQILRVTNCETPIYLVQIFEEIWAFKDVKFFEGNFWWG